MDDVDIYLCTQMAAHMARTGSNFVCLSGFPTPPCQSKNALTGLDSVLAERADDPCAGLHCHAGAVCEIWNDPSRERVGVCTCMSISELEASGRCTRRLGRVCASNGRLYDSQCHLLQATCLQQTMVNIVSWTAVNEADCLQQATRNSKPENCHYNHNGYHQDRICHLNRPYSKTIYNKPITTTTTTTIIILTTTTMTTSTTSIASTTISATRINCSAYQN
ncbi:unnamed protein product [Schistocephalus solidus]|uniref:Kazal-like domain-containing protein n=1 Tax=Schistocephalus solidus TaxID=70667 RepID=A0A183T2B1_SCHSO|nr:unnamed protein product [Schistocephalus solidus]